MNEITNGTFMHPVCGICKKSIKNYEAFFSRLGDTVYVHVNCHWKEIEDAYRQESYENLMKEKDKGE